MYEKEDLLQDVAMYFRQIDEISNLMIQADTFAVENLLTIRDLVALASDKIKKFSLEN